MSRRSAWILAGWLAGASWGGADTFVPQVDDRMSALTGLSRILELPPGPDVVAKLAGYAGWQDPAVAMGAVRRLGELGPAAAEAIPVLMEGLRRQTAAGGENRDARGPGTPRFGGALAKIGPGRWDVLVALLEAAAAQKRSFPWQDVRSWREGSENGNALLRRAVLDSSLPVGQRHIALSTLSMTQDSELVPQLEDLARNPDLCPAVRGYAIRASGDASRILPALVDLAVSQAAKDEEFARQVFMHVGNTGSTDSTPLIRKLLSLVFDPGHPFDAGWSPPEPQPVTSMASSALRAISRHAVAELIGAYLDDPSPEVRCGAAMLSWGGLGESELAHRMRSRLGSESEVERTVFASSLVWVPSCRSDAVGVLVRSATSSTLTNLCRRLAARALGMEVTRQGMTPEVRVGLEACARDPDPVVQKAGRTALEFEASRRLEEESGARNPAPDDPTEAIQVEAGKP